MSKNLTPLGQARVYRDARSGELVVDTDSIRRGNFAGDDIGDDDDFGDDDFGDDDGGEDFGDDFGARGNSRRRRDGQGKSGKGKAGGPGKPKGALDWGMTALSKTDTLTGAGSASVQLRLQHDFLAEDITFDGSLSGAKVTSIFFGDNAIWSSANGIPVSVFGANSFLRGMLKGQSLKAGLDITVNGTLTGAGDFSVTITGKKPVTRTC